MSSKDGSVDSRAFSVREILAGEAPKEAPVTVKGWVRTRRDSKAGVSFVHLSDGSSFNPLQVVAPNTLPNYTDEVLKLTAGCALEATGTIVPSPAKGQVTIPADIREQAGLLPYTEVDFEFDGKVVRIVRTDARSKPGRGARLVAHLRGRGDIAMSTDAIMALTRDE